MHLGAARGLPTLRHTIPLAVCLVASGCASTRPRSVTGAEAAPDDGWASVENVAVVHQTSKDGCGAAALAMVLGHWGRPVTQDDIRAASPPTPGQGIRADALRDFARRQGLQAFLVEGEVADIDREVGRDRPVLVGVLKRQGRRAYPHYEVIVGLNQQRRRILTLDPARGRRERSLKDFIAEWTAAGRLTIVVFPRTPARASAAQQHP